MRVSKVSSQGAQTARDLPTANHRTLVLFGGSANARFLTSFGMTDFLIAGWTLNGERTPKISQ
jgi:hypothetical protein